MGAEGEAHPLDGSLLYSKDFGYNERMVLGENEDAARKLARGAPPAEKREEMREAGQYTPYRNNNHNLYCNPNRYPTNVGNPRPTSEAGRRAKRGESRQELLQNDMCRGERERPKVGNIRQRW